MIFYTIFPAPIGDLYLTSDGAALTGVWMEGRKPDLSAARSRDDLPVFVSAKAWLTDYFVGNSREIDFPLLPAGTAFQKRVWALLLTIPWGEATTYGTIAGQLGQSMSAQAVGQAVGKNPISILIPCHRCLGTGGKLTGYAGGLKTKEWLLRHEHIAFRH